MAVTELLVLHVAVHGLASEARSLDGARYLMLCLEIETRRIGLSWLAFVDLGALDCAGYARHIRLSKRPVTLRKNEPPATRGTTDTYTPNL